LLVEGRNRRDRAVSALARRSFHWLAPEFAAAAALQDGMRRKPAAFLQHFKDAVVRRLDSDEPENWVCAW
jgi:hypothetical protein